MPEIPAITDENELKQFLAIPESQVPTLDTGPNPLFPRTRRELEKLAGPMTDQGFLEQEQQPGVPLQLYAGEDLSTFSPWTRFQVARRQTAAEQQSYLEKHFGKENVRKAEKTDDFIIRMNDPKTGKPKDVVLNERDISIGDVGALAAQSPEIALSLLVSALGGGLGSVSKIPEFIRPLTTGLGRLVGGAAGYKLGQAGQQVETELADTGATKPVAIAGQKLKELPAQTVADAFAAGIFKGFSTLNRLRKGGPGMFQTPVEKEGLPAAQRLAKRTGTSPLSYSAGEASGMPLLDYLEAYAGSKPQSAAIRDQFKAAQRNEVEAIYDAITSKAGTDEQAGENLLQFIQRNQAAKQRALDRIKESMSERESQALTAQLGKLAPLQIPFKPSAAGHEFRNRLQRTWQGIKGKVQQAYQTAYSMPTAMDPDVPTKPIADTIDRLRDSFPTAQGTAWLDTLKKELVPHERYRDLVQRRSDLWDKIETAPSDRSTKDYIFGQLSNAYTELLDAAAGQIKDFRFAVAIKRANEIYKKEELPFYQAGIHDVLRKSGERGSPENLELLKRFENTDLYRRLTDVSGRGPGTASEVIRSSVIDGLMSKSGREAIDPKNIDAATFSKNLEAFASNRNTREMFNDIFGNRAADIRKQAKALMGVQGSIPKEELERFLATAPTTRGTRLSLLSIKNAQDQLDRVEGRRLLKSPTEFVNPEQVANRFLRFYTDSELKGLTGRLETEAPGILDQLRDKVTEQILGKAGAAESITSNSLRNVLADPEMASKYKQVLGPRFDDLMDFSKALGPRDRAREIGKATGLLIKGESIGELAKAFEPSGAKTGPGLLGRLIGIVPGWLGWKMTTKAITSGAFREWASNGYPPGWDKSIQAGLITEPFLMDIASSTGSPEILQNVAMGIRKWSNRVSQPAAKPIEQPPIQDVEELRKFLKQ